MVSVKMGAGQQAIRCAGFGDQGPASITTNETPDGQRDKNQTDQNSNASESADMNTYGNENSKQVETDQDDSQDELILRRLLASRRSSEGCALKYSPNQFLSRRNSGGFASLTQTFDELLPTVTEGQTMDHEAFCGSRRTCSQTGDDGSSGLSSAASSLGNQYLCSIMDRVNSRYLSKDDITSSPFSSLEKMDSSSSGHYRRRSSTVSQCSSVLSETSRAQLNFDLSPDLPLDSTIIQANMLDAYQSDSQHLVKRPQTPEPYSVDSSDGSVDEIPIPMASKARLFTPELMLMDQVAMSYGSASGSDDLDEVSRCLNGIISRQSGEEGSVELSGSLGDSIISGGSLDYSSTPASDNRLIPDHNDPMSRLVSSIESMSGPIRTRTMSESPSENIMTKSQQNSHLL